MSKPHTTAWVKPSGHGPSCRHLVKQEDDEKIETWCGREIAMDREFLDDEAGSECKRCLLTWRRDLLSREDLSLEEMAGAQLVTDQSAAIISEHELDPTEIEGTGKHGRILTEDARKAARAAQGEES